MTIRRLGNTCRRKKLKALGISSRSPFVPYSALSSYGFKPCLV